MGSGPERRFLVTGRLSGPVGARLTTATAFARSVGDGGGSGEQRSDGAEGGEGDEERLSPRPAFH